MICVFDPSVEFGGLLDFLNILIALTIRSIAAVMGERGELAYRPSSCCIDHAHHRLWVVGNNRHTARGSSPVHRQRQPPAAEQQAAGRDELDRAPSCWLTP